MISFRNSHAVLFQRSSAYDFHFERFDYIYAMDAAVLRELEAMRPASYKGELGLFLDLTPDAGMREVPDPYHMGPEGFEHVLDLVEAASAALAASLSSRRRA